MQSLPFDVIPATYGILIAMVGLSLMAFSNPELKRRLLFNPYMVRHHNDYLRLPGHVFIHADLLHLFFNGFVFWSFGSMLELTFTQPDFFGRLLQLPFWGEANGRFYFLIIFLGGAIFAALPAMVRHANNPGYNALGASGGVSAILMAYILLFPTHSLYLMFIPIPIPAFVVGIGFLFYESYMNKRGGTGIAHDAHFWGGIFGIVFLLFLNPRFALRFISEIGDWFQSF
jgi:membrane associated rhomboid family serine protease